MPAVYADGSICLDILQNQWSPIYDVAAVLTSIQASQHACTCITLSAWDSVARIRSPDMITDSIPACSSLYCATQTRRRRQTRRRQRCMQTTGEQCQGN